MRVFQARRAALGRHFYLWEEQGSSRRGPGKDVRSLDTAVQLPAAFSGTTCFGPSSGWSFCLSRVSAKFKLALGRLSEKFDCHPRLFIYCNLLYLRMGI